jgi:hypothetical protein
LGTNAPAAALQVVSGNIRLDNNQGIEWGGANNYIYGNETTDFIAVATNGNERLRVDSSGRLGLGTSSPGELLDVAGNIRQTGNTAGTANTVGLIDFYNANNTTTIARINVRTDGAANSGSYRISTASAGTLNEVIRIDSSGRVGIGVTGPGALLHCSTSSSEVIRANSNNANGPYIVLQSGGSGVVHLGTSAAIASGSASDAALRTENNLCFFKGVTETARIDSSGRLLVGTSTARSNLYNTTYAPQIQLEGNDNSNSTLSIISCFNGTSIGGQLILGKANSGSVGSNGVVTSGTPLGRLSFQGNDGTEFVEGGAITCEVDGTPGANDMPGRLVFSTTADGASSPTERMRITSTGQMRLAGAGITFNGDTATANELDDYEEGTWTPVLTAPTQPTITYTAQSANYTKIGNVVYCRLAFNANITVAGSGQLVVSLPFAAANLSTNWQHSRTGFYAGSVVTEAIAPQFNSATAALYSAIATSDGAAVGTRIFAVNFFYLVA